MTWPGTHMDRHEVIWKYSQMVATSGPAFDIEHIKRVRMHGIQAYFALGHHPPTRDRGATHPAACWVS